MGSGNDKRNRAMAIRASHLSEEGVSHRRIAAMIGKRPEQVKSIVALGDRLRAAGLPTPSTGSDSR